MTKKILEETFGPIEAYVDTTGTAEKPNPLRDVYEEFPLSMIAISKVTAFGAKKHAPRGWKTFEHDYAIDYHGSKLGRHLLDRELHGEINPADGDNLHSAAVAWNALARLEHILMKMEKNDG
jgi:hypothetical protein